jgi:general stress protein 26
MARHIWFLSGADLDGGGDIVFMTAADTVKGKAILRYTRVSLCWDYERPPFSYVTVTGGSDRIHGRRRSQVVSDAHRWALHGP